MKLAASERFKILPDAMVFSGIASATYGIYLFSQPLSYVFLGGSAILYGILLAYSQGK
jgi:hypothetical protein